MVYLKIEPYFGHKVSGTLRRQRIKKAREEACSILISVINEIECCKGWQLEAEPGNGVHRCYFFKQGCRGWWAAC